MRQFAKALSYAVEGIRHAVSTQRNLRFHLLAAVIAVLLGFIKRLEQTEWMILTLLIASVISAELMNTAIEAVVDLISPQHHPLAKVAKDAAAGAVLVLSIGALVIGCLLFL